MVGNCVHMSSPGVVIELLESVYQRDSSRLHVINDKIFQKRQTLNGDNKWFKLNFRIFNSSSEKFLVERFLTSYCVKGLLLFFVKFRNFFTWVVIIDCSLFFVLRKSNFLIISQSIVLSFDLIVVSIFLIFLPKIFLSRMRLCIALFLNFFLKHKVSYSSIFRMLTYINLGKTTNILQLIKKFMPSCDLFRLTCTFFNLRKSLKFVSLYLRAISCIIHP